MSFQTGTQTELLYSLVTPVTNNTFTTRRIISAGSGAPRCILNGNFFNAYSIGKGLLVQAAGLVSATSGTNNLTFDMSLNPTIGTVGTAIAATPAITVTASVANAGWNYQMMLTCTAVSSTTLTLQADGFMNIGVVAAGTVSTAPQTVYLDANVATLNSESQNEVSLNGTWSASSASNSITIKQFFVFGLN